MSIPLRLLNFCPLGVPLVTGNKKHFPEPLLQEYGIHTVVILNPDEFLDSHLGKLTFPGINGHRFRPDNEINLTGDKGWYKKFIALADRMYEEHLEFLRREGVLSDGKEV
ncbi:MAG: hypothetical protein ACOYJV_08045 [Aminivibrio sp.]